MKKNDSIFVISIKISFFYIILTIYLYINYRIKILEKMNQIQRCSKCGEKMKRIPIKRLDSTIIIEYYCDKCDESITFYPNFDKIKVKNANIF